MENNKTSPTYPGNRQNDAQPNEDVFRDLSIINQPAGGLEFVNTKGDEMVTLYHKNGTLLRFNKYSTDELHPLDKREHIIGDSRTEINGNNIVMVDKTKEEIILGDAYQKIGDVVKESKAQEEYKKALRPSHQIKRLFEVQRVAYDNVIDHAKDQKQSGGYASCPVEDTDGKFIFTSEATEYTASIKSPGNSTPPEFTEVKTEYKTVSPGGDFCATCNGSHESPSTQDGDWAAESSKEKLTQLRIDLQKQLLEIEKKLGRNDQPDSGTKIEQITKDYVGMVGMTFNDLESFRRDATGKLVPNGVKISPDGSHIQVQYTHSPLVEQVSVDRLPGGGYDLTCNDHYNLVAGSNGISIKTTGPMELYSPTIHQTSEDIQIHSRGEIALAAERIDINADVISIRPNTTSKNIHGDNAAPEQQVLIDGNLQVAANAIIRGGAHIEGELTIQHITAPLEIQQTYESWEWGKQKSCEMDTTGAESCMEPPEKSTVYADILQGCEIGTNKYDVIGQCSDGATCVIPARTIIIESLLSENSVQVHPHFHNYASIPTKLVGANTQINNTYNGKTFSGALDPNSAVRSIGSSNNLPNPVQPLPTQNATSQFSIVEKFGGVCEPISINNGSWQTSNDLDTLPDGDGCRTKKYTVDEVQSLIAELDRKYEQRYTELAKKLESLIA